MFEGMRKGQLRMEGIFTTNLIRDADFELVQLYTKRVHALLDEKRGRI